MTRRESGFTLIELMIVIAIIAIIAAIAIPNLLSAKTNANETSAIVTLRNLMSAQNLVAVTGKIDADQDGKGEHGTFGEMTGAVGRRTSFDAGTGTATFATKGPVIEPAVLSAALSRITDQGFVQKAGYVFQMFLPDGSMPADFVHETGPTASLGLAGGTATISCDYAEQFWCCYGQPQIWGQTGTRRFFINQRGDVVQSVNGTVKGAGIGTAVIGNSALLGTGITSAIAVGTRGNDGEIWKSAN